MTAPTPLTFTGEIESIKFRNAEDGWSIFRVTGQPHPCTGTLAELCETGTTVTCTGELTQNVKFGQQIKCSSVVPEPPDFESDIGVARLLCRLPGIGPVKSKKLVEKFGAAQAWEYAKTAPEELGVHVNFADDVMDLANLLDTSFAATVYLLSIGLTDRQAAKIIAQYKHDTIKVVSENPYVLIDGIQGFGYLTVDKIALKAGISLNNPSRVKACIRYVLDDSAMSDGHVWREGWELARVVLETLTESAMKNGKALADAPDKQAVKKCVYQLGSEGLLVIQDGKVFSKDVLDAEVKILEFLRR